MQRPSILTVKKQQGQEQQQGFCLAALASSIKHTAEPSSQQCLSLSGCLFPAMQKDVDKTVPKGRTIFLKRREKLVKTNQFASQILWSFCVNLSAI